MPPAPEGSVQQALLAQYGYLYRMASQLRAALDETGQQTIQTAQAAAAAQSAPLQKSQQALRAMIIKTSRQVEAKMTQIETTLAGSYVAKSDFGTYVQQLSAYLEANPEAITQYYKFASDLQASLSRVDAAFGSYQAETEGYIRTGIVYYDGALPVYGVAVGQNLTATTVDGETVIDRRDFRATFTAKKLSFWQDETEVAYVSNNTLYISEVSVLQRMTLGKWLLEGGGDLRILWIGG